jgi:uncharacterized membrane protein YhiD involved in acid resistance
MSYSVKCAVILLALGLVAAGAWAVQPADSSGAGLAQAMPPGHVSEKAELLQAVISLPIAAALGAALAFRPQRRGTPPRDPAVIQTQIILALVGALVMLVVGASLARAFGIVGAASLVRYRSKIDDPKDAVVMLSALAVGLASGVGLYALSTFSTVFLVGALWVIESFEPRTRIFELSVKLGDKTEELRPKIEALLRRYKTEFEIRTVSEGEAAYVVTAPSAIPTDDVSKALVALDTDGKGAVEWKEITKKEAK